MILKNFLKFTIGLLIFTIIVSVNSFAQSGIGFFGGLSTPNDKVHDVYDGKTIDNIGSILRDGAKLGYHVGANVRIAIGEGLFFRSGISWHRFPEIDLEVYDPRDDKLLVILGSTQNIIPITAGINYYITRDALGIYATGELSFNYISNSVDFNGIPLAGLSLPKSENRVGFAIGGGCDFDLGLMVLNLEAKYNVANLIGKYDDESTISFVSLSFGVYLGSSGVNSTKGK